MSTALSTARNALLEIEPTILEYLIYLDLSNSLNLQQSQVVNLGAFGDISKGSCTTPGRSEVEVSIKRLHFHINSQDFKTVRACSSKRQ